MRTSPDCTSADTLRKEIRYDRITKDYALYLDGQLVGYAAHHDGERILDELARSVLTQQYTAKPAA